MFTEVLLILPGRILSDLELDGSLVRVQPRTAVSSAYVCEGLSSVTRDLQFIFLLNFK